jgi:hypothetical protein
LQIELNCMTNIYLNYIDKNANKFIETFGEYIDNNYTSAEVLAVIFSRDSFGVSEIDIFDCIHKWFARNRRSKSGKSRIKKYKNCLTKCIRLELMTIPQLTSIVKLSNIIDETIIARVIQTLKLKNAIIKRYRNYTEASIQFGIS